MREKKNRLRDLAELQSRVRDLAAWKLAAKESETSALHSAREEMIQSLARMNDQGMPTVLATQALRSLERRLDASREQSKLLSRRSLEEEAKARAADRRRKIVDAVEERKAEIRSLDELMEASAARRELSLR